MVTAEGEARIWRIVISRSSAAETGSPLNNICCKVRALDMPNTTPRQSSTFVEIVPYCQRTIGLENDDEQAAAGRVHHHRGALRRCLRGVLGRGHLDGGP